MIIDNKYSRVTSHSFGVTLIDNYIQIRSAEHVKLYIITQGMAFLANFSQNQSFDLLLLPVLLDY